jgi:hypothetical protein
VSDLPDEKSSFFLSRAMKKRTSAPLVRPGRQFRVPVKESAMPKSTASKTKKPALVSLTPEEVRHTLKPIARVAELIEPMLAFYAANENALRIEGLDVGKIHTAQEAYQALQQPIREAEEALATLRESSLFYASTAYHGFLELYVRGQVAARVDHKVARGMVKFQQAMKKPRKNKGTPSSGSGTPPSTP